MNKKELNSKNIPDAEISTANSTHNPQPATHNSLYTTHNPQSAIHNALPTTYNTQLTTINNLPTTPQKERIILGIDPGTAVMGYGLVREIGTKIELISLGVVKMDKIDDHMLKLQRIFEKTVALIDNYHPDCLAIEAPFYGKNIQVMLKLGRAQGVAMSAALSRNVTITEYSPRKIKQAITGNGNATKEQVAAMLQTLLKFTETPDFLDATDGLAVAVCHSFQRFPAGKTNSKKSYSGWDTFAKDNAKRII